MKSYKIRGATRNSYAKARWPFATLTALKKGIALKMLAVGVTIFRPPGKGYICTFVKTLTYDTHSCNRLYR